MPATTGLGAAALTMARSVWAELAKFSVNTVGPTASMVPTWASIAAGPVTVNSIAPTLLNVAPLPLPTVKLKKGTNTCWVAVPSLVLGIVKVADDQSPASV